MKSFEEQVGKAWSATHQGLPVKLRQSELVQTQAETEKQESPEAVYARGETWFMTNGHYKSSQKKQNIQQILLE